MISKLETVNLFDQACTKPKNTATHQKKIFTVLLDSFNALDPLSSELPGRDYSGVC